MFHEYVLISTLKQPFMLFILVAYFGGPRPFANIEKEDFAIFLGLNDLA